MGDVPHVPAARLYCSKILAGELNGGLEMCPVPPWQVIFCLALERLGDGHLSVGTRTPLLVPLWPTEVRGSEHPVHPQSVPLA